MGKVVSNLHFFLPNEVAVWLSQKYLEEEISFEEGTNFSFDEIEQPAHCVIKKENGITEIQMFERSHLGVYPDEAHLQMKVHKDGTVTTAVSEDSLFRGNTEQLLKHYLRVGFGVYSIAFEQDFMSQFTDMDLEQEGILIKLEDNNTLNPVRVKGSERPDMVGISMFGLEMGRPYLDEVCSSMMEDLDEDMD